MQIKPRRISSCFWILVHVSCKQIKTFHNLASGPPYHFRSACRSIVAGSYTGMSPGCWCTCRRFYTVLGRGTRQCLKHAVRSSNNTRTDTAFNTDILKRLFGRKRRSFSHYSQFRIGDPLVFLSWTTFCFVICNYETKQLTLLASKQISYK